MNINFLNFAPFHQPYLTYFSSMYNNTIIRFAFCDIQNNQVLGKGYQPKLKDEPDKPFLDLDYSGKHRNLIQLQNTGPLRTTCFARVKIFWRTKYNIDVSKWLWIL